MNDYLRWNKCLDELKQCPFCHGHEMHGDEIDSTLLTTDEKEWRQVVCNYCGAGGETDLELSVVIKAWNTRPIEDALNNLIAELEQENATLRGRIWEHEAKGGFEDNASLKESQQWIPVSERLPVINLSSLVADVRSGEVDMAYLIGTFKNQWFYVDDGKEFVGVTHWRPLPEPPGECGMNESKANRLIHAVVYAGRIRKLVLRRRTVAKTICDLQKYIVELEKENRSAKHALDVWHDSYIELEKQFYAMKKQIGEEK